MRKVGDPQLSNSITIKAACRFEAHMLDTLHRPFLFKIKVAEDTYQDETRIKTTTLK